MTDASPRRLHPATLVLSLVRGAPSTLLGLPAILAVTSKINLAYVVGIAIAGTLAAGFVRWLAWRRYTYALTADAVVIESGLLSRNRRTIPFDRVQDVDIERRLLARLFGLAKVTLETGGGDADEGTLDSVSLAEAHRLREVIRHRASPSATTVDASETAMPIGDGAATDVVFAMDFRRLTISGLYNFSLVWLAVIFGALQYAEDFLPFDIGDRIVWDKVGARAGMAADVPILGWVALAGTVAALGIVSGIVRTILRDFGFTLTDERGRFRRIRGLLTHSEVVIALRRVQLAVTDTGVFRRVFRWSRLRLQTLGGDGAAGLQDVVPFGRDSEIDAVLAPLDWTRPDPATLRQVSSGHIWRSVLRGVGAPVVAIAIAGVFAPAAMLAAILLVPMLGIALFRRRHHRYGLPADTLYVQRGVLDRRMWIVPAHNVQVIAIRRTWLQRRLSIATLAPDIAGGGGRDGPCVYDIALDDAWALARRLRVAADDASCRQ